MQAITLHAHLVTEKALWKAFCLCRVAVGKMEGFTNEKIAVQLDCSLRTVARKLETIRIIWSGEPAT